MGLDNNIHLYVPPQELDYLFLVWFMDYSASRIFKLLVNDEKQVDNMNIIILLLQKECKDTLWTLHGLRRG
jgi:hypothetical protein